MVVTYQSYSLPHQIAFMATLICVFYVVNFSLENARYELFYNFFLQTADVAIDKWLLVNVKIILVIDLDEN